MIFKISSILTAIFLPLSLLVYNHQKASFIQYPPYVSSNNSSKSIAIKKPKAQLALLLDTSNSMDGLIDQAKSQLWKMVNKIATAKKNNEIIELEIALFEYGNDNLSADEGYIRMISPLSTDVDKLSEELFKMSTKGGSEYCGWVIKDAVNNLGWSSDNSDLKLIIIAGNEPFTQGPKHFKESCKAAMNKGIIINTIHCGDWETGIRDGWQDGASCSQGKYLNIDQDQKIVHIPTPWDEQMIKLNDRLNKTYIGYGHEGKMKKELQMVQDVNANVYGKSNAAERTSFKAKAQYKNDSWDIVDAMKEKKTIKKEDLPEEMQKMSEEERKAYIEKLSKDRSGIQNEILELDKKIQEFRLKAQKENSEANTLDKVMEGAIVEQAKAKGFEF